MHLTGRGIDNELGHGTDVNREFPLGFLPIYQRLDLLIGVGARCQTRFHHQSCLANHLIAGAALQEPITDITCNPELHSKDEQKNQAELDLEVHEVNLPHKCPTKELAARASARGPRSLAGHSHFARVRNIQVDLAESDQSLMILGPLVGIHSDVFALRSRLRCCPCTTFR